MSSSSAKNGSRDAISVRRREMSTPEIEANSDDDVIVTSGAICTDDSDVIGLFDVVKRDFRCETAKIRNRPRYEEPEVDKVESPPTPFPEVSRDVTGSDRKSNRKLSFIQEMKGKVSMSIDLKNKGLEEMEKCDYRAAIKNFHHSLLYLKGLDPEEGVEMSKDDDDDSCIGCHGKQNLRKMPVKLKEIKEKTEIENYLNLTACLLRKPKPPYERIKQYSIRIIEIEHDHVKALLHAGISCYHLNELDLAKFYLTTACRHLRLDSTLMMSTSSTADNSPDSELRKYLEKVENQLNKRRKKSVTS